MSDNELGAFLRARREAVTPAEVGLPAGSRRRTPGLRRAELATLAGISVDYLIRLEQGRDRNPSPQVLAALADALRLPGGDRWHLLGLFKTRGGVDRLLCHEGQPPTLVVRPTVRAVLEGLEPAPALVVNRVGDVLAFTRGYARLAGPVGILDAEPPNLLRFVFTDPRARSVYPDWDRVADAGVASLKLMSPSPDPHVEALSEELTVVAGAAFTGRLAAPPALPRQGVGVERWAHPEVGELRLASEAMELSDAGGQRLVVYLAADDASAAALGRLVGRQPGALRAVTG